MSPRSSWAGFDRVRVGSGAGGAQTNQSNHDEPADGGLGPQATRSCEGVEAVARELVRRDIIAEVPGFCPLDQQVSDEIGELLLCAGDMLTSMQECREFGPVVLVGHERERVEHSFEPLASVARSVADFREIFEMARYLTFMPSDQDRFDVREVFVQRRTSDAGLLGNLRHRNRPQPVFGHQCRGGVQRPVDYRAAVRLNCLAPELRHDLSIRDGGILTICLDIDMVYRKLLPLSSP